MGQFSASLKVPGDAISLPATVDIDDGRMLVASGEHVIGDWALVDIDLTPGPEGVHISAEGEELILQFSESAAFEEAAGLNIGKKSIVSMPRPFKLPTLSKTPKHISPAGSTRPEGVGPTPEVATVAQVAPEPPTRHPPRIRSRPSSRGPSTELWNELRRQSEATFLAGCSAEVGHSWFSPHWRSQSFSRHWSPPCS